MTVYQTQGTIRPEAVTILETIVEVASDIREVEVEHEGDISTEYAFTVTEYSKDEYIAKQDEDITDLQLALTELYEGMM